MTDMIYLSGSASRAVLAARRGTIAPGLHAAWNSPGGAGAPTQYSTHLKGLGGDRTMLIDEVAALVRQAAPPVLDLYDPPSFAMAGKADAPPLTAADLAAQETITPGLRSL